VLQMEEQGDTRVVYIAHHVLIESALECILCHVVDKRAAVVLGNDAEGCLKQSAVEAVFTWNIHLHHKGNVVFQILHADVCMLHQGLHKIAFFL